MSAIVRRPISKSTRFQVITRDKSTCQYCGRSAPNVVLHVDHYIPVAAGGPDDFWNLLTACQDCNAGKAARFSKRIINSGGWRYEISKISPDRNDSIVTITAFFNDEWPYKEPSLEEYFQEYGPEEVEDAFRKTKGLILHTDRIYNFDWRISELIGCRWGTTERFLNSMFCLTGLRQENKSKWMPYVPCPLEFGEMLLEMILREPSGTFCWSYPNNGVF